MTTENERPGARVPDSAPRVVIVGGGFGSLAAVKALRKTDAEVLLVAPPSLFHEVS